MSEPIAFNFETSDRNTREDITRNRIPVTNKVKKTEKDPNFSENALEILKRRYLLRDKSGKVIETPEELLRRISNAI
ncbi:MAG: hypothetical protein DRP96_08200, partial [Candidatus Neomarinimicrobiota bacterium]